MSEKLHESKAGFTLCHPSSLQLKASDREAVLTDNRDPRNYFGFKVIVRSVPLASGETIDDAVKRLVESIKQGAAKRDHAEVRRGKSTLAGLPAQEVVLRYTLDAGRVEYTDADGKSRSAGDEPVALEVRLLAAQHDKTLLAAWRIADQRRLPELDQRFEEILKTLKLRAR